MNRIVLISIILAAGACSSASMKNNERAPEQKTVINSNVNGKGPEIIN